MKTTNRIFSLLLCVCMALTLLPAISSSASAAGASSMMLGARGISGAGSNWVYFGEDSGNPVKWRVLAETGGNGGTYTDNSGTSVDSGDVMFLMSEYIFLMSNSNWTNARIAFDSDGVANIGQTNAKDWQGSDVQAWCIDRYNDTSNFTSIEKVAITATTKTDQTSASYGACGLSAEHLFFLSYFEVTNADYGFTDNSSRLCKVSDSNDNHVSWLLRTPFSSLDLVGMVMWGGTAGAGANLKDSYFTRPALNLNRRSVLFSSAAAGGKSVSGMDGGLTAVSSASPIDWKLTLLDSSRGFSASINNIDYSSKILEINYTGASVGLNEYISAVILSSDNDIKYYGRVTQPSSAAGTATIDITNLGEGDTISVFSEQYNGDYETDYASNMVPLLTVVDYDITHLACSNPYARYGVSYIGRIQSLTGYRLPENISVTIGGTTATPASSLAEADSAGEYFYDNITGDIKVAYVDGPVVIKAAGIANFPSGGSSPTYYTISASAGTGGKISPSGNAYVAYGNDKTYTITANEGYEIENVSVDGVSVGAVSSYTFENVNKAHTITVSFTKKIVNPFSDVDINDWFYENVMFVYKNRLMTGTSSDTFSPNGYMTRAMLVTVLYRLSGDIETYTNVFTDVPYGEWYENAAAWAAKNGIAKGVGNGSFAPNENITREQLAVMLYNYAMHKRLDVSVGESTNILSFNDAFNISDYAYEAIKWACGTGIIKGNGNGNLNPQGFATRAEAAAMLQRFIEKTAG